MILRLVPLKLCKGYINLLHIVSISYPNVPLRTSTKNRATFCVKLALIYASAYQLPVLQQHNDKFQ